MLPCWSMHPFKGWCCFYSPAAHGMQWGILKTLITSHLVGSWVFERPTAAQPGVTGRHL